MDRTSAARNRRNATARPSAPIRASVPCAAPRARSTSSSAGSRVLPIAAAPNRGPRPKTTTEQQFCGLGPAAEAFLVGAAAIGNTRLPAELDVLLALGAAHGTDALIGALGRAVAFRRFRAADVRSI